MPARTSAAPQLETGNGATFAAMVKARVLAALAHKIDKEVERRQKLFPRASRADVLRDALDEYFKTHKANAKAGA